MEEAIARSAAEGARMQEVFNDLKQELARLPTISLAPLAAGSSAANGNNGKRDDELDNMEPMAVDDGA